MNLARKSMVAAALVAFAGATGAAGAKPVTIKIETGGTIKVGDYETVCDKKPKSCGGDYDPLPPRPRPKPRPAR